MYAKSKTENQPTFAVNACRLSTPNRGAGGRKEGGLHITLKSILRPVFMQIHRTW